VRAIPAAAVVVDPRFGKILIAVRIPKAAPVPGLFVRNPISGGWVLVRVMAALGGALYVLQVGLSIERVRAAGISIGR